jgi:hypothetical protein
MEQSLGKNNALTVSWVGAAGRNLLRQDYFVDPNQNFTYVYLLTNTGFSDFESMQTQFQRRLAHGLQVLASWTWSHSLDNASNDSSSYLEAIIVNPLRDRGPSDFDIRHAVSAAFSYDLKYRWLRGWGFDGVYTFRTLTSAISVMGRLVFARIWCPMRRFILMIQTWLVVGVLIRRRLCCRVVIRDGRGRWAAMSCEDFRWTS